MDLQTVDEWVNYVIALKSQLQQKDTMINQLREELKNTKITSKPIKGQKDG